MAEATWGDGEIDWRMSAALENVPRAGEDVPEVTSLEGAVRAWLALDARHRHDAILTAERPVRSGGEMRTRFAGESIRDLVDRLPG